MKSIYSRFYKNPIILPFISQVKSFLLLDFFGLLHYFLAKTFWVGTFSKIIFGWQLSPAMDSTKMRRCPFEQRSQTGQRINRLEGHSCFWSKLHCSDNWGHLLNTVQQLLSRCVLESFWSSSEFRSVREGRIKEILGLSRSTFGEFWWESERVWESLGALGSV